MQTVTCAVMKEKGKIFLSQRKPGDWLEHKWEFPGGKVEPGETPEQCLERGSGLGVRDPCNTDDRAQTFRRQTKYSL